VAQLIFEAVTRTGPVLALVLQAGVLSRFLNPRNRDYPLAILFALGLFLLTLAAYFFAEISNLLPAASPQDGKRTFFLAYSAADLFMHILLVALMLQLIRKTLKSLELNTRVIYLLAALSVLVAVCAYTWFGGNVAIRPVLRTRQVISFWMVLLNLYWWTLLLRRRQLDRRILLLSAGVGLMMTGQVVGDGMVAFASKQPWISLCAALIMYGTHFACLYTWYNAFNPSHALSQTPKLDQSLT
jgi:hypothetical protein